MHIGNTVLPVWFEDARKPIFESIHPSLDPKDWPLILAHIDLDYRRQIFVSHEVLVKTSITDIGRKSFNVYHEVWQQDQLAASGNAVMVFFDYASSVTIEIPDDIRSKLSAFVVK